MVFGNGDAQAQLCGFAGIRPPAWDGWNSADHAPP